jgi:predicted nucleic acid-binding protein
VLLDACVLHPPTIRDTLLRCAVGGLIRVRWSSSILDEWQRSIERARPDLEVPRLLRTRDRMNLAVEDALVTGYEALIENISLPDPNDRHVLAAAVIGEAEAIVTFNLGDFPEEELGRHQIVAMHPDDLLCAILVFDSMTVIGILRDQAQSLNNPPFTLDDLLDRLARDGMERSVAHIRTLV